MPTFKDRIQSYISDSDYKLLPRVPLLISINGRSFSKITAGLDKPFSLELSEALIHTTSKLFQEIEGAIFAYHFNDEMLFVVRNDTNQNTSPWFDNKIQKLSSVTASMATYYFNSHSIINDLDLIGEPIFTSTVFVVPNIAEAINTVILKQQQHMISSIHNACFYELIKLKDKNDIKEILSGLSSDDKVTFLKENFNIEYSDYHPVYRRGVAFYKIPKIIDNTVKYKLGVNKDLPIFSYDQEMLMNIFKNGHDVLR